MRRLLPTMLAVLAVFPAAAAAQSAGDEQYRDPFGEVPEETQPAAPPSSVPADTSPPAETAAPAGDEAAASGSAPTADGELANTGAEVIPILVAGLIMLLAGVTLTRIERSSVS